MHWIVFLLLIVFAGVTFAAPDHAKLQGTRHIDGSTYVDLVTAPVSPGDTATVGVNVPEGSVMITGSIQYTDEASGKFETIKAMLTTSGRFTLIARNTSKTTVRLVAVFRYQEQPR